MFSLLLLVFLLGSGLGSSLLLLLCRGSNGLLLLLCGGSGGLCWGSRCLGGSLLLVSNGFLFLLGGNCLLFLLLFLSRGGLLGDIASELLELLGDTLIFADVVLCASGLSLFDELLFTDLLLLHSVDGLDQDGLVLELVTLGAEVELVVDVLGDLLGIAILAEKTTEDTLSSHP